MPEGQSFDAGRTWAPIAATPAFIISLFLTAQNWRDNLQARLEGFRERIVEVWLGPDEGGLNLWMDASMRCTMLNKGIRAGKHLDGFNLDVHRGSRTAQLERLLERRQDQIRDVLVEAGVAAGVPRGQAGALDLSALLALAHQTFVDRSKHSLVEVDASLGEISVRPTY